MDQAKDGEIRVLGQNLLELKLMRVNEIPDSQEGLRGVTASWMDAHEARDRIETEAARLVELYVLLQRLPNCPEPLCGPVASQYVAVLPNVVIT